METAGGEAFGTEPGSLSPWEAGQVEAIQAALAHPAVARAVIELVTGQDPGTRRERRLEAARDELRGYTITVNLEES